MKKNQYRKLIEELGLNQSSAARFLGISERMSRAYALGEYPVNPPIAKFLKTMAHYHLRPERIDEEID
jgi:predicted transcriptional regulator